MIRDVLKKSAKSVTEFDEPVWKGALGIDACLCARVQEIHFAIVGHVGRKRRFVLVEKVLQAGCTCFVKASVDNDADRGGGHSKRPSGGSAIIRPEARSTVGTAARVKGIRTVLLPPLI